MPGLVNAPVRAVIALIATAAVMIGLSPAATAHTELRSSDPEAGATVDTLDSVSLVFSSAILDIGSELILVDSAGDTHALTPEYPDPTVVSAAVDTQLPAGDTVLQWRIVAEDGHPIEGEVAFTLASTGAEANESSGGASAVPSATPAPSDAPLPSATPSPVDGQLIAPNPDASVSPSPSPTADADDDGGVANPWVWMIVAVAVVGTAAAALIAQSRRR
ncbi:copper resistance CopC family protein [Demequina globuliformis]|uniref:copper resistance CopC family protein n=1 Tax=Demequina globuliformis TaxID=676202 RepID=UPI000784A315|nr:copper resistance CopC family protein [Demequina globuliformis]